MALCDTCTTVWQGQTCNQKVQAHDFTDCWPPRSGSQSNLDPGVMMGWGFYSPGIACPAGYSTVAMATAGGAQGWNVEYSMLPGETAAACCPSGFAISSVTAPDVPTTAQTCVMTATSASFITVQCDTGAFAEFSDVTVPQTVSNKVLSSYVLFAPLYQLNFKASDLPVKTTSQSPTPSSSPASSRPTTSLPSQTSGSPTATSSPTTGSGSASPSATPPPGVDPSGGLATGAKIGIGVGVALGALLLIALAVILRGRRKRKERAAAPIGAGQDRKEKGPQAELAGEEVRELDGRPVVSELPTRLPSGRVPPRKTGPNIRRSDQGWVVSPIEPHGDAVFELEGDSTPTSTFESRGR